MKRNSLDSILEGFTPNLATDGGHKPCSTLTIWVPTELKARYDQLQKASGRKFSKVIRELLTAAIERADTQT